MRTAKRPVPVVVYTDRYRIEGVYHLTPQVRFLDDLNLRQREFVALTDARIAPLEPSGRVEEDAFVAVNKQRVVLVVPQDGGEGSAPQKS